MVVHTFTQSRSWEAEAAESTFQASQGYIVKLCLKNKSRVSLGYTDNLSNKR